MAIPAEATGHMMACLVGEAGDGVFDCACEEMAVMGKAGGEGRAVIEREDGAALAEFVGCVESVDVLPVRKHALLCGGEANTLGDLAGCRHGAVVV